MKIYGSDGVLKQVIVSSLVTAGIQSISAGTTRATAGQLVFSNSNGVSFGIDGSTLTASFTGAGGGGAALSAGSQSINTGTVVFSNSNGVTFGMSGSSRITASHDGLTSQSNQALSGSNGSFTFQTASFGNSNGASFYTSNGSMVLAYTSPVFSNSNNVSFGLNGVTVTATATMVQSNQTVGWYAGSNTTGQSSSSTRDARSLNIVGAGIISVGLSNGDLIISASAAGAADGYNIIAAGTQTANTTGSVVFSDSNGISFGMSGNTRITASYTVPSTAGLLSNVNLSAGTLAQNLSNIVLSNSNGVSFGLNASTITGSVAAGATATGNLGAIAAGTQTATSGTMVFSDSNGISFGMSGSSRITASYTVPSTAGLLSNVNISAGTTSQNLSALVFSNSNNVSFGLNGSTVTATITVPAQTAQSLGLYGSSQTTGQSSSSTVDARSLSIVGAGGVSVGLSNGSFIVSAGAGAGGVGLSAGTQSVNTGTVAFADSNGISFGMSNSSRITASYTVPAQLSAGMSTAGNTVGDTGLVTARLALVGGNNITLSGSTNGGSMTITVSGANIGGAQTGISGIIVSNTTYTSGTVSFSNANGISFGSSAGQAITASYTVPAATVFSNSNNVSFGLNGSTVTATATFAQTAQTVGRYALGNTTGQSSSSTWDARSLSMAGAGIISIGNSAGSGLVISATQSNQAFSADASSTFQTLSFQNSNGVSFSNNAGALRVTHDLQYTSATSNITSNALHTSVSRVINVVAATNNTGGGTASLSSNVSFSAANGLTFYTSAGGAIVGSYTVPVVPTAYVSSVNGSSGAISLNVGSSLSASTNGSSITFGLASNITTALQSAGAYLTTAAQSSVSNVSLAVAATNNAGGGTASLSGAVSFSNANGLTFYTSAGNAIVGSYTVPTVPAQMSAGNSTGGNVAGDSGVVTGRLVLVGGNNVTLSGSTNGGSMTLTISGANIGGAQTGISGVVVSNTTYTSGTVSFSNANGISFGSSAGQAITASYTVPGATVFSNSNNVSFGLNGSTVTATATHPGAAVSLSGNSTSAGGGYSNVSTGTLVLAGGNNITLSQNGASVTISGANIGGAQTGISGVVVSNTTYTSGTVSFSNANGISFGSSAGQAITASYTVPGATVFSNSNNVSFGLNGSTITATATFAGAGFSAGLSNLGNTAGSTGVTGTRLVLVGINNINLSQSTDANGGTVSFAGQALPAFSADASSTFLTLTLQNSNGISFSNNAGAVRLTHDLQYTSNTSNITSNALHSSASRVINVVAATNNTGGGTASLSSNISFSNANGMTFYTSAGNAIVGSYTVPAVPGAYVSSVNGSSGAISLNVGSSLSASTNGSSITFGLASNITTALQSAGAYLTTAAQSSVSNVSLVVAATNNTGGGTASLSGGVSFSNANGLTFYTSAGNAVVGSYSRNVVSNAIQAIGSATGSGTNTSRFAADDHVHAGVFSMGVSTGGNIAGDTRVDVGRFVLAGGANITLSQATAAGALNTISIVGGGGAADGVNVIAAGTQTANTTGTVLFNNGGGVFFGMSNSSVVTGRVTANIYGQGDTTGDASSASRDIQSLSLRGTGGYISVGLSNGSVIFSATQPPMVVAGINGSYTDLTLRFSNANGVTFNTATVDLITTTRSYVAASVAAQSNQTGGIYASWGNTTGQSSSSTYDIRSLTIRGLGIVSVGHVTDVVSGTAFVISATQSNHAVSNSAGSFTFQTLNFSNANNVTWGTSAGGIITASVAAPGAAAESNAFNLLGANTAGNTTATGSTIGLSGLNLTLSGTNASQIVISAPPVSSLSATGIVSISSNGSTISIGAPAHSVGMSTGGNTVGTTGFGTDRLVLAGGNNITLSGSTNAGSMTITISGGAGGAGAAISAGTQSNNTGTVVFSNANGITFGMSNSSVITASAATGAQWNFAAGTQNVSTGTTVSFINSNRITFGMSGSGNITASHAVNISAGTTSGDVNALTFSNANGVSFGLNAGTITAAHNGQTMPLATADILWLTSGLDMITHQHGQSSLHLCPRPNVPHVSFVAVSMPILASCATNSTCNLTINWHVGFYTKNANSLSLVSSSSTAQAYTLNGTQNSASYSGERGIGFGWNCTLSASDYVVGLLSYTQTANNNATVSNLAVSARASNFSGVMGSANNQSYTRMRGLGYLSVQTAALPNAVAYTDMVGTGSGAMRVVPLGFYNG